MLVAFAMHAKATHIVFSKKKINIFAIFQDRNFNVKLANTSLSFEQLDSVV